MENKLKINELNTRTVKKELKADAVRFRYHNKNKTGGNFGINIIFGEWGTKDYKNFEITGYYDINGFLYGLRIGTAYQLGTKKENIEDLNTLIGYLKIMIEERAEEQEKRALMYMGVEE